jgi:DNA repair exonuclease SbcCD nuclease subunit
VSGAGRDAQHRGDLLGDAAAPAVRVLLLADSHLGFDMPVRPPTRRRRGPDFFANLERALAPALTGEVDLVVHGGDVFDRPRPRREWVGRAVDLLARAAEQVPVVIIPGNHERSSLPEPLYWLRPQLHVLGDPATVCLDVRGIRVAVAGIPFMRADVHEAFLPALEETRWREVDADLRLLALHQTVEGATVGPRDHVFRRGRDVIPGRLLPTGFAAILSGHIHRRQVLRHDLAGTPLPCPVVYPGSVERTALAEVGEPKGTFLLTFVPDPQGGRMVEARPLPLPARPMEAIVLECAPLGDAEGVRRFLRARLAELDPQAVVRVTVTGPVPVAAQEAIGGAAIRALAPETMTIEVGYPRA